MNFDKKFLCLWYLSDSRRMVLILSNREAKVKIKSQSNNQYFSNWETVKSGAPQGWVNAKALAFHNIHTESSDKYCIRTHTIY
jgi:hypothetical protein